MNTSDVFLDFFQEVGVLWTHTEKKAYFLRSPQSMLRLRYKEGFVSIQLPVAGCLQTKGFACKFDVNHLWLGSPVSHIAVIFFSAFDIFHVKLMCIYTFSEYDRLTKGFQENLCFCRMKKIVAVSDYTNKEKA